MQCKQFSETNAILDAFQQISNLKVFLECFRGPLKTLWRATCGPRACSWTTLLYSTIYMRSVMGATIWNHQTSKRSLKTAVIQTSK